MKGDILLFKGKGIFQKIVDWLTKGKYNHIEIMITDMLALRIYARGATVRCATRRGLDYDIERPEYKDMDKAIHRAHEILNSIPRYGFLNFIAFACIKILRKLKIRWFEGDKFVTCSEAVADCLVAGGVQKLKEIPNSLLSPNDIPRVFVMKKYTG